MGLGNVVGAVQDPLYQVALAEGEAEDLGELAHHYGDGHTIEQAHQYGAGEKVRQYPQLEAAGDQAPEAGHGGHGHHQLPLAGGIPGGERRHHGGNDGAGGGIRADDELAGGAKEGVDHHGQYAGVEADDGAHPGELRIGDGHGQGHGRHREASAKIRHQPGPLILQQGGEARQPAFEREEVAHYLTH